MTVVVTATKPAGVKDGPAGSSECRVRDITLDTGTYVTAGNIITALSVGLKTIDFVDFGTQGMTGGTSGATINWIGVTYAATGLPGLEKTSAEATVANATFRVKFESWA